MPAFDKTGPQGMGPSTGKGLGRCINGMGFGRRMGCGRGLGRYFGWNMPKTKEDQIEDMEAYRKALKEELEDTDKALTSLRNG